MAQLTLQPDASAGKDSYLHSVESDTNYGTTAFDLVGVSNSKSGARKYRFIIDFDISGIAAGSTITAVTFTLTRESSTQDVDYWARRITQSAWTEAGVTWNKYDGTTAWAAAGGDYTSTDQSSASSIGANDLIFNDAGLVAQAQEALDNQAGIMRILVMGQDESNVSKGKRFYSSDDATAANRPKLELTYTLPSTGAPWWFRRFIMRKRSAA